MRWHGLLLLLIVPLVQCALWQGDVETKRQLRFYVPGLILLLAGLYS